MKKKNIALAVVFAALTAAVAVVPWAFAEEKLTLNQVPTAARAAIQQHASQGKIVKVESETKNGQTVYEAELRVDGKKEEIVVAEDGTLLPSDAEDKEEADDTEAAISWEQLPAPVQNSLAKIVPAQQIEALNREVEDGSTFFEAEYKANGVAHAVKLTDNGYVVESEQPVATTSLPPAVAATVQKQFKNAEIKKAEMVQLTFYEVKVEAKGKQYEVKIQANGNVIPEDKGD